MYPLPSDRERSLTVTQRKAEAVKAFRNFIIGFLLMAVLLLVVGWHDFEKAKTVGENLNQLFEILQAAACAGIVGSAAGPMWQAINRSGWLNPGAGYSEKEIEFCKEQLKGIDEDMGRNSYTGEARENYLRTRTHFEERLKIATDKEQRMIETSKKDAQTRNPKQSNDES